MGTGGADFIQGAQDTVPHRLEGIPGPGYGKLLAGVLLQDVEQPGKDHHCPAAHSCCCLPVADSVCF